VFNYKKTSIEGLGLYSTKDIEELTTNYNLYTYPKNVIRYSRVLSSNLS